MKRRLMTILLLLSFSLTLVGSAQAANHSSRLPKEITDVYWQQDRIANASGSTQFSLGVSFPDKYVTATPEASLLFGTPVFIVRSAQKGQGMDADVIYMLVCGGIVLIYWLVKAISWGQGVSPRRGAHVSPKITSEGTGARYGLTAVEAAVLLQRPIDTVLTMVLFGVLKKRAARILSPKPLELQVTEPLPEGLHEYEVDFLKAFQADKARWVDELQTGMVKLVGSVSNKMRGFSRTESVYYYMRLVEEAWQEVKAAATPEVKSQKFDEKMDWALLDGNFAGRSAEALGAGPLPMPGWWERYTLLIQPAAPATSQGDIPTVSAGLDWPAGALPELPGADFAASIANGIQDFSAAAIGDVQHFASEIADQTSFLITETGGGHDDGYDGGHDGGYDSGSDGGFEGGHDGGDFDGGDFDGGDIDFD